MPDLNGSWTGNAYGTHLALVYAVLVQQDRRVAADIRVTIRDSVSRYTGAAELSEQLALTLTQQVAQGEEAATITVASRVLTDLRIEATWESSFGGAGILTLAKHPFAVAADGPQLRVPQLETRVVQLAPVRLNRDDLGRLVEVIQSALPNSPGVIITASTGSTSTANFARDFLARRDLPLSPSAVVMNALQNEGGAQKKIGISIGHETNQLNVEWLDRQWVIGASELLAEFFRQRSNRVLDFYRRHLKDINWLALLTTLIFLPDLMWYQRIEFVVVLIALLYLHTKIIQRISRTQIDLAPDVKASTSLFWPTVLSLVTGVVTAVVAIMIYDLIREMGWPYGVP